MNKFIAIVAATVALAGCESRVATDTTGGTTTTGTTGTPASGTSVVGDLKSAQYDSTSNALTVQITLDDDTLLQDYGTGTLTGTYYRYTLQNTPTDTNRAFTAFAGESTDQSVQAVVVMDGGQFNRFFGGAAVTQANYTAPSGGIIDYQGSYVGLLNFGPVAGAGVTGSASSVPHSATEVTGDVFLKADFTDGAVNGAVYNRLANSGATAMPELVLVVGSAIGADGSFSGAVEDDTTQTAWGTYSGVFGGTDASSVAGIVELGAGFLPAAIPANGNEQEIGIFVLDQVAVP